MPADFAEPLLASRDLARTGRAKDINAREDAPRSLFEKLRQAGVGGSMTYEELGASLHRRCTGWKYDRPSALGELSLDAPDHSQQFLAGQVGMIRPPREISRFEVVRKSHALGATFQFHALLPSIALVDLLDRAIGLRYLPLERTRLIGRPVLDRVVSLHEFPQALEAGQGGGKG